MKEIRTILFISFLLSDLILSAQNVGVNIAGPQATLDVRGTSRFGGLTNYISHDSVTGRIAWNNSRLFLPVSQQLIGHSASAEGLYYNNPALEYRNQFGTTIFSTNWNTGNSYFIGNMGIGAINPIGKLHVQSGVSGFPASFGNVITESNSNNYLSFYGTNLSVSAIYFNKPGQLLSGGYIYNNLDNPNGITLKTNTLDRVWVYGNGHVGIGNYANEAKLYIEDGASGYAGGHFYGITLEGDGNRYINTIAPPQTLNGIIFRRSDTSEAGFVYDSPANPNSIQFRADIFRTRMVLSDIGYLGIGNLNPAYILDVNSRMRIRSGGNNFTSAGIWFNNSGNNEAAFMGMQDDSHIGFWGQAGSNWRFSMNTITGTLSINGSEGTNNYVLTSMGSTNPPEWRSPTKFLYDNTQMKTQSADITMTNSTPAIIIPNLSFTFTVTSNAKVIVSSSLCVIQTNDAFAPNGNISVDLQLNGGFVTRMSEDLDKGNLSILRNEFVVPVPAGTHTIRLVANTPPQTLIIYSTGPFPSNVIFKVIPE